MIGFDIPRDQYNHLVHEDIKELREKIKTGKVVEEERTMFVPMSTPEDGKDDYILMAVKGKKIIVCSFDGKSLKACKFKDLSMKGHEDLVAEIARKSNKLKERINNARKA